MRVKTKKLASLVTASILAFSATIGGVGITASAYTKTTTDLVLCTFQSNSANIYSAQTAYGYRQWNYGSTLNAGNMAKGGTSDTWYNYLDRSYINTLVTSKTSLVTNDSSYLKDGDYRYRMIPLLKNNTTPSSTNARTFWTKDTDISNKYISVDMAKGIGYNDVKNGNINKTLSFYVGLAHVDYTTSSKVNKNDVYPADVLWYDITDKVTALNTVNKSLTWTAQKKTVSVKVSDILNSTNHQYVQGASAQNIDAVDKGNANAVVFGVDMITTYVASSAVLAWDDLRIETKIDDPEPAKAVTEKNSDDTYKAGIVFDEINPSDYANVVFKVGNNYYGNTVESAFGAVINGPANIGVILNDATDPDVSVWFTNQTIEFE